MESEATQGKWDAAPDPLNHIELSVRPGFSSVASRCLSSFTGASGPFRIAVPPTGAIYLNLIIRGNIAFDISGIVNRPAPRVYFGGQLHREMPITHIHGPFLMVGMAFRPTGFHRLFGVDAATLTDRLLALEEIDKALAKRLEEALPDIDSPEAGTALLQDALTDRLPTANQPSLCEHAVDELLACGGRMEISALSERYGVSQRHLQRVFRREVGVPPKAFAKIIQINEVVALLQAGEQEAMNQLALANGYYDQAHFVRDFTRLVGSNPGQFVASRDPFLRLFLGRRSRH